MNPAATTRSNVLQVLGTVADSFHQRGDDHPVPGLQNVPPEVAAMIARELRRADDWARSPEGLAEEADEMEDDDDYVSHDPWIATVQAGIDEHADNDPAGDFVSLLETVGKSLMRRARNRVPFIPPKSNSDQTFALKDSCRVVLVGDWGTAKPRARRVARAIAATRPDEIIHLGDIYPSGTPSRAHKRFIDVWKEEVGSSPRYWAMNGNHEMNADGEGYFRDVLDFCQHQEASFFCLRNEHWKLIAIDTAYVDHDLHPAQLPWLEHQLSEGPGNNIVLSHHQMFSAIDRRPSRNVHKLPTTLRPVAAGGRIFGWFWGHEHRAMFYGRHEGFGSYHARAIGHGGKRVRQPNNQHLGPGFAPPVVRYWDVPRPDKPHRCMNGFALLTFTGPEVQIDYIDEMGTVQVSEIWPHSPLR